MELTQAKILEWVAIPPPVDLPDPRIESVFPAPPALQVNSKTVLSSHEYVNES